MTFQDSGANVSKKIYTKCGKPTFNRSRRKVDYKNASEDNPNMEIRTEPMKMPGKKKHKKVEQIERSTLEKIIIDIKQVCTFNITHESFYPFGRAILFLEHIFRLHSFLWLHCLTEAKFRILITYIIENITRVICRHCCCQSRISKSQPSNFSSCILDKCIV